ncbi:MAG: NAD(P)/FAD-dependent oxidoreductase, partial [Acidimicrobiia bacterium]
MADAREVVILGGGPAGAGAALLLTRWGHRVRVITKAGAEHPLAVSVPPSCAKLFAELGVTDAIERAGFTRSTGNTVWWGSTDARVERFASGAMGWQLDAGRLAEVILREAVALGAQVERRMVSELPEGFILDCTGRAGVIARARNVRRHTSDLRTIALIAQWRRPQAWPVPDDTHTLIESYSDGWMWSVPVAEGVRHIAAMVDPQRSGLVRNRSAMHVYRAEIGKTRAFSRLVDGAEMVNGPWGWDASQYDAREYGGENWLLVGDAASFVDPLSSAGVKKALASAWLAAITAHTCLVTPSMRDHALRFYGDREREIAGHYARESTRFLAEAAAEHQRGFWEGRSEDLTDVSTDQDAVSRAFERLKAGDRLVARPGPGARIEPRPCVVGHAIVLEPHVTQGAGDSGVRHVHGVQV